MELISLSRRGWSSQVTKSYACKSHSQPWTLGLSMLGCTIDNIFCQDELDCNWRWKLEVVAGLFQPLFTRNLSRGLLTFSGVTTRFREANTLASFTKPNSPSQHHYHCHHILCCFPRTNWELGLKWSNTHRDGRSLLQCFSRWEKVAFSGLRACHYICSVLLVWHFVRPAI